MMRQVATGLLLMAALLLTAGCASRSIDGPRYLDTVPDFRIEEFFDGQVSAWGIVQDRSGNVTQRFKVDIDGRWENGVLTLDETFSYAVGEGMERRVWEIEQADDGRWVGRAGDILDTASGLNYGNAFRWQYRMDLPVGDRSYTVSFDDWLWAFDDKALINRSYITKFGITFAEVTIFMQKRES